MEVESWIQANTLIVGWKMYDLLWSLLIATGIVFVPIILILTETFLKARSRGAMSNISSEGVLAEFEMKLFVLFLVFFFAAMPASVDLQAANSIKLWNDDNDFLSQPNQPTNSTACNTGSTGDATVNAPVTGGQGICTDNVRVPLWWYITQSVSQGLTMAVVKEVATQNNNLYRATRKFLAMSNIKDPENKDWLNILDNECRVQAVATHRESGNPGTVVAGDEGVDLNYVGSEFLRTTYYDTLFTQSVVVGMPPAPAFSGDVQPEYQGPAVSTQQNCNVLWTAFRAAVVNEATENLGWVDRLLTTGLGIINRDDEIVRTYTLQTKTSESLTTETTNQLAGAQGAISKAANLAEDHFQVYELMKTAFTTGMYVDVLIVGLPMLQAYILMLVIMALPFGFVISGYSFGFLFQGTILIFTISFWPALWALVSWADQVLADQFFAGGDGLLRATGQLAMDYALAKEGQTGQTLENITTVLTHNLVVASLYVLSPVVFSWVMSAASAGIAGSVGGSATGGGMARSMVSGGSAGKLGRGLRAGGAKALTKK